MTWIFADLKPFVDKITSVLKKLSIDYSSQSAQDFCQRKRIQSPQIIFLNGNNGKKYLQEQSQHIGQNDLIYLVLSPSLPPDEKTEQIDLFLKEFHQCKGIIDERWPLGLISSQLRGIKKISDLLFEVDMDQDYFEDFEQRLSEVSKHLSDQLKSVKQLHRILTPQRQLQFGRLKTFCKYASGDSNHSEFWDIARTKKHQLSFLLSTESSKDLSKMLSQTISFLNEKQYNIKKITHFYQYFKMALGDSFSVFMMLTDIDTPRSTILMDAPFLSFFNGNPLEMNPPGQTTAIEMKEGDKLFVISPGMIKNYEKDFQTEELLRIIKMKWQLQSEELMDQVFLHSKINKKGPFHYHDGTCIIFEVEI